MLLNQGKKTRANKKWMLVKTLTEVSMMSMLCEIEGLFSLVYYAVEKLGSQVSTYGMNLNDPTHFV